MLLNGIWRKKFSYSVYLLLLLSAISIQGCTGMAINMTKPVLTKMLIEPAMEVILREDDLPLALQSIGGQLKLTEILLKSMPEDKVRLMVCQGFSSYALLQEPKIRKLQFRAENTDDEKEREELEKEVAKEQKRLKKFALRGRDRCLEILEGRYPGFRKAALSGEKFKEYLKKLNKKDVDALFWAGFGWGYAIINDLEDSVLIAQIPQLRQLMHRVVELDDSYFYGGAHVFLGSLYSQSPTFGGDLKKAQEHFDRAEQITEKKSLLVHYYKAKFFAQQKADTQLCQKLLRQIHQTPVNVKPEINLLNAWAKEMGAIALKNQEEFCP